MAFVGDLKTMKSDNPLSIYARNLQLYAFKVKLNDKYNSIQHSYSSVCHVLSQKGRPSPGTALQS